MCFCVVEPEIPYLLTESDFFFFLSLLLFCVGLGESGFSDMGSFSIRGTFEGKIIGLKKHSQPLKS